MRTSDELRDAEPRPVWWDGAHTGPQTQSLRGRVKADLVVVGGGYAGLWAAIEALTADPGRRVVVLEQSAWRCCGREGGARFTDRCFGRV